MSPCLPSYYVSNNQKQGVIPSFLARLTLKLVGTYLSLIRPQGFFLFKFLKDFKELNFKQPNSITGRQQYYLDTITFSWMLWANVCRIELCFPPCDWRHCFHNLLHPISIFMSPSIWREMYSIFFLLFLLFFFHVFLHGKGDILLLFCFLSLLSFFFLYIFQ